VIGDCQLAVQDRRLCMDLFHEGSSKVLTASELVFLPGKKPVLSMLDDCQSAKATVLNFIDPVPVIERFWLLNQRHRLWNDLKTVYQPLWSFCLTVFSSSVFFQYYPQAGLPNSQVLA
jgi:hypothetical protein